MKRKLDRKQRRARRIRLVLFACVAYGTVAIFQWLNTAAAQQKIVSWISGHTTWEITLDRWEWRLLSNTLMVADLTLHHRTTGHHLHADRITLHYNPWPLAMGKFVAKDLLLDRVAVDFSHMKPPVSGRQPITLKKLLLLQRIAVRNAVANDITITLPKERTLNVAALRFSLQPSLLGDVRLNAQVEAARLLGIGAEAEEPEALANLDTLALSGATDMRRWVNTPPFVNAVKGALAISGGSFRKISVRDLTGVASVNHSRLGLDKLHAIVNDKPLDGDGAIDLESQEYAANLSWPEPMSVPEFFDDTRFMNSAGTIQGAITVKGHGFDPKESTGEGNADLTHVSAAVTNVPVRLVAGATWKEGVLKIKDLKLTGGDGVVTATGGVSIPGKKIDLHFKGENVPLEAVLGKFSDHHFHPVRGAASVDGSFVGWPKDFVLDIGAEASRGSYYDIAVERARMKLHLTYGRLEFSGQIFQGNRATGQTDFTITYGPKTPGKPRQKQLHLTARLDGHNLWPSFTAYALKGAGNGTLTIDGPPANFRANGYAEIVNGSFFDLPLKHVSTNIAIVPLLITYTNGRIDLPDTPPIILSQPLKMPITDYGFRLTGTPRPDTSLDMSYNIAGHRWTIHSINYADSTYPDRRVSITGGGSSGNWDLNIRGTGNLSLLEYMRASVREAAGPVSLDLKLRGALDSPLLYGTARIKDASLLLRALPYQLEQLEGVLRFSGQEIHFDPVTGQAGDGTFNLTGFVRQADLGITSYDVSLKGTNFQFASPDRHLRAELDGDLSWRGDRSRSTVSGDLTVLDAKYDRDFRILEQMGRTETAAMRAELRAIKEGWAGIGLNVRVRNTGDIWIRNNAADVALRADAIVRGSIAHPQVQGAIEVTEGKLHYLGLNFDIMNGLVEFHPPFTHPYIEMTGEKEVREYLVRITLRGPADNLTLDLNSTPGLERKDVLALLAFGATQEELRTAQFGAQVGPSVFLEQVGKLVERPISKLTGLDVVRVEPRIGSGGGTEGSRLYLGKRLNDRLAVEFMTGVTEQSSEQGFQVEYNITDFLLLKAAQPAGQKTRVNMSLRFRER